MKSLSVIIPTVQVKPKILNKLLAVLDKDDVVDEILLINNAQKEFIPIINKRSESSMYRKSFCLAYGRS